MVQETENWLLVITEAECVYRVVWTKPWNVFSLHTAFKGWSSHCQIVKY